MARINLLPWRAERRKAREREFYSMLGFAALGGVLLSVLIWFYYDAQISGQTERNAFLTAEIDKVKAQNEEIKEPRQEEGPPARPQEGDRGACRPIVRRWCICSIRWCAPFLMAWP